MIFISQSALLDYFESRSNRFKNSKGMELGIVDGNECWTYFSLCNHSRGPLAINISTEADCPEHFIEQFKITTINDIDALDYNNSWMRYLNGEAEIAVCPFELEAELKFKIINRKTIIFSLDLHFYDEVYEHLTLPEDFEKYITGRQKALDLAAENRYRMG
jgi:hypothetical protein